MSGGGVFNSSGELVGVVVGFSKVTMKGKYYSGTGTIIPLGDKGVRSWMKTITGKEYL